MFDQRGELPLLPFGNPIGPSTLLRMVSLSNHFVPASRGGVYIILASEGFYRDSNLLARVLYPPSQKAAGVNPWMNARRLFFLAFAKENTLRRVAPDEACGGCRGRKPVGLHLEAQQSSV